MTAWSFLSDGMPCIASLRISASDGTIELEVRHLLHAFDGDDVNVDKASRKGKVKLKEHKRTYPFQHDASESMEIKTVKKVFVESISMELPLIVLAQPHDASYGNSDGISQSHSSTSLYFYILMKTWRWSSQQGGESWKLELYSTLTLESNNATASRLQMILLDGPFLVIFDYASGYILVVHASMDDTLPFEIVLTEKISPPALWSKMRLDDGSFRRTEFSCQRFHYSEDSDYILAHIILSSSSTQNTSIYSDGVENYHFWTRLCIAKNTGKSDSGNRCGEHWLNEYCGRKGQEQVTCAFIAQKNKIESFSPFTQTCSFPGPDEYMMVGTTHNRLKLYQNNVLCASSDLLATPRDIIMLAHRSSLDEESGAIVCAVYCSDIAASCFIVFIERSHKKMLRLRLSQHFEYVGEIFTCHLDPESIQIILSNVVREKNISLSDFVVEKFHHAIVMSLQEQTGWDAFHLTCKKVILKRTFEDDADTVRQLRQIESSQDVPLLPLHVRRVEKYLNKNKSTHLPATFGDKLRQDTQQLANLLRSLEIRVELGKRELERTESIVRDKLNLVAHMNSLLIDQYNDTHKTLQGKKMTLSRILLENIPYRRLSLGSHKASMIQVISVDAQAREGMRRKPQPVDTVPMHADLGSKAAGNHSYEVFAIISHSITLFDPSQSTISLQLEIRNGSSVSLTQAFVTICTSCSTCNQNGSKIPAKSYSVSSIQTLAASKSANFSFDWKVPVVWNSTVPNLGKVIVGIHLHASTETECGDHMYTRTHPLEFLPSHDSCFVGCITLHPAQFLHRPKPKLSCPLASSVWTPLLLVSKGCNLRTIFPSDMLKVRFEELKGVVEYIIIRRQFVMLSLWTSWSSLIWCIQLILQAHPGAFHICWNVATSEKADLDLITRLHASLLNEMRSLQRLMLPLEWDAREETSTRGRISWPCQLQKITNLNALALLARRARRTQVFSDMESK